MNKKIEIFLRKAVTNDGFALVEQVLTTQTIESLIEAIAYSQA